MGYLAACGSVSVERWTLDDSMSTVALDVRWFFFPTVIDGRSAPRAMCLPFRYRGIVP